MENISDAVHAGGIVSNAANPKGMAELKALAAHQLPRGLSILSWALQLVAAGILFQTLFFKFTGSEESVYIFSTLGMEPWGRIGSGIAELVASLLLVMPRTIVLGALLSLGVISGAIMSHLTKLGIVVKDDGGLLFGLALVVFACSLAVVAIRRADLGAWANRLGVRGRDRDVR